MKESAKTGRHGGISAKAGAKGGGKQMSAIISVRRCKVAVGCNKDNRGLLQKLLSFRYQKPNQIPIEGTVSNPEFEPNQISEPEPDENRSSFDLREVD